MTENVEMGAKIVIFLLIIGYLSFGYHLAILIPKVYTKIPLQWKFMRKTIRTSHIEIGLIFLNIVLAILHKYPYQLYIDLAVIVWALISIGYTFIRLHITYQEGEGL